MSGHFHVRQVLKCLDRALLVRYFTERRPEREIAARAEDAPHTAELWDLVPKELQADVEEDLRSVFDVADDKGMASLHDEAAFHGVDLHADIDHLDGLENKALAALLKNEDIFGKAVTIRQADGLHGRSWRRWAGLPPSERSITEEMGARLARSVGEYFYQKEGRGLPCDVQRYLRRGHLHYVFLYPADHARRVQVYEGEALELRDQKPAFDVVFTFDTHSGILSVWTTGNKDVKVELKRMFCETVFGADIQTMDPIATEYRLNSLLRGSADLALDGADGLEKVTVRKLTLAPVGRAERITFDLPRDTATNVEPILRSHLKALDDRYCVVEASLTFFLEPLRTGSRRRSFTFDLNSSGFSNLNNKPDEYKALGEKYLRLWGIDPADAAA